MECSITANGWQLGAVCVGLWEGNCAKVLLCWCGWLVREAVCFIKKLRKRWN